MGKRRPGRLLICALALAVVAAAPAYGGGKGKAPVAGKSVIGGKKVKFANWAFTVAIQRKGRLHCGGSVIAPTKILTAAHCLEGFGVSRLSVAANRPKLTRRGVGETIGVVSAVAHPDYVFNQAHDVGVITLAAPTTSPPVVLATPELDAELSRPGRRLRVAGWGAQNPLGVHLSRILKRTTERVHSPRRCKRAYRRLFRTSSMICALGKRLRRYGRARIHASACSGDSGGPLVADTPAGPVETGIVSFGGPFCGFTGAPTVYSRVSDSLDFINEQL